MSIQRSWLLLLLMVSTLIVAATEVEVSGLKNELEGNENIAFLITGVGMVNTVFSMTKSLSVKAYSRILNVGIAGTFSRDIELGQVVQVSEERFSELGAQNNDTFLKAEEMGLLPIDDLAFKSKVRFDGLAEARGITVNTIHGEQRSIDQATDLFDPHVESMEGAAVAYVSQKFGIEWAEIRAISNYVEPRNRDSWRVELAIENLTKAVSNILIQE